MPNNKQNNKDNELRDEIVKKLREPVNWMREERGIDWKNGVAKYDRVPFKAADLIETLHQREQQIIDKIMDEQFETLDMNDDQLGEFISKVFGEDWNK